MFEIFVAEAVIFGAEDQRDFTACCRGSDDVGATSRGVLAVAAIESGAAGGADDQRAVGDRIAKGFVAFGFAKISRPCTAIALGPKAPGARFADDGELAGAEIFHRPRHRADIARAARANQNDSKILNIVSGKRQ